MKIAVVILNWNGKKLLETFLPSIIAYSKEATIYVADNASSDDSLAFVENNFTTVKIIKNKENGGYAKGYNDALKDLKEDIFCLINSDIEVTEQWLTPIIQTFKNEENTAIIQPKILDYKNKSYFEYAGAAGGFIDKFGYPFCRGRIFNTIEKDLGQYNNNTKILWATGACFFIRRNVFNSLNGFDESFFAHMEEIDLCWRAYNQDFETKYIWNSTVYHVGGATLNAVNPKKTYLNFRNSLATLTKNASGNLFILILVRLTLDGFAAIKFLLELKPAHILAILKAHFAFYSRLPKLLKERKSLQQKRLYFKQKSIVWSYFIDNKKLFSDL
ncbi:glycosyltransferase family 2 protein [Lacinutrix sp. 5H-3-7-4]|uniref:glycosyltransferase family 2 protein n=1 Tax=Lacinutrix sp. (strain 5H-3-7-4) TaxID=983544 RepID=UPI00020A3ADC|nr:glycosyltransferase family 2 protein [Lacinutrix sp. 5H-3-7-4]AEH02690.1 glycosyl transferase family 2 [Lacinutrix sp. 5H-3-7-4]